MATKSGVQDVRGVAYGSVWDLKRNLALRTHELEVMVAQTCGKFTMLQPVFFRYYFGWAIITVGDAVVDVDEQFLAIVVAVHPGVAVPMQGRIVQGQVQEQFCTKHEQRQQEILQLH